MDCGSQLKWYAWAVAKCQTGLLLDLMVQQHVAALKLQIYMLHPWAIHEQPMVHTSCWQFVQNVTAAQQSMTSVYTFRPC